MTNKTCSEDGCNELIFAAFEKCSTHTIREGDMVGLDKSGRLVKIAGLKALEQESDTMTRPEEIITYFKKADKAKPRPDLMPKGFLLEMGKVLAYGAEKYGIDNWKKCDDPERYQAAAMRHLVAYLDGEELDPESGLPHLAHCACSLAILYGVTRPAEVVRSHFPEGFVLSRDELEKAPKP